MKKFIVTLFLISISLFINESIFAQSNCKVLNESINQTYEGKCKKGLAHGKGVAKGIESYEGNFKNGLPHGNGTYYYQDGSFYTGDWKNGMKSGEGKLVSNSNGKENKKVGIWEKDVYVGEIPPISYQIKYKLGVDRFSLSKDGDKQQRVLIQFFQNGGVNTSVENVRLEASSGRQVSIPNFHGFEYIEFPFVCKISYSTLNKFRTSRNEVKFEFVINEPGEWSLDLHN
ncbi:MAG: hypothetical protein Q8S44_08485 [Flavobacteriaceae bacterium]|nr:hypothetical protein [Flavobacteriaceae bacterium]